MYWWGVYENDELIAVMKRYSRPTVMDFDILRFSSKYYEIREVEIIALD
jgi:hypothetical protein